MPLTKFDHSKKMHFRCCGMANGTNEPVQILCKFWGYFNYILIYIFVKKKVNEDQSFENTKMTLTISIKILFENFK